MDILAYIKKSSHAMERGSLGLREFLHAMISLTEDPRNLPPFLTKDMDVTQCLSLLVDILNEPKPNVELAEMVLLLLNNITQDEVMCKMLHNTYDLSTSLSMFILNCHENGSEFHAVIAKCLEVMRKVTYNSRLSQQNNHIPDLLKFLMKIITQPESDATLSALGLMANLCRHSVSVQAYVKSSENFNDFVKSLLRNLRHDKTAVMILTLLIKFSLCLLDDSGIKFFSSVKHMNMSLQVIFGAIVNRQESDIVRSYAVDLLTDLIKNPKTQKSVVTNENLDMFLRKLLAFISKSQNVDKIFEMLLSFCSVNSLRCVVCRSLFDSPALQDSLVYQKMMVENNLSEPFFAIVHWARQSVETHSKAPLLALDLLRELYEEAIDSGETMKLMPQSELVLPTVTEILMSPLKGPALKQECQRIVKAIQLLKVLCLDASLQRQVAESIDTRTFIQLIKYQVDNNKIADLVTKKITDVMDWCDAGVDVVLHTLDLAMKLNDAVPNMKSKVQDTLLDGQISPFLAYAITSESRERVQLVLHLLAKSIYHAEFPATTLGDNISTFNGKLRQGSSFGMMSSNVTHQDSLYSSNKGNILCRIAPKRSMSIPQDEDVDTLIAQMHAGLEIKNKTSSELIDIYAHKIRALETQENHLKDLLDAKTMALAQADRLNSNYRCQNAKAEAEAHRLKSLILQSEKNSELCREQLNEVMLQRNQVSNENRRLQAIVEEHEQLLVQFSTQRESYNGLSNEYQQLMGVHDANCAKLDTTEQKLANLQSQYKTIQEMYSSLEKSVSQLMKQLEEKNSVLLELGDEHRKVLKNHDIELNEKITANEKLTKAMIKLEEKFKKLIQEEASLNNELIKLNKTKDKLEKSKEGQQDKIYKLEEKVKTMEGIAQVKEKKLKEQQKEIQSKDKKLRDQQVEIENLSKISAMIHNLTNGSGKLSNTMDNSS